MKLRKWLKRIAFVLAVLITLAALALGVENYRGRRAWETCKRELTAQGEPLDWPVPVPVPDDQNFFQTPLLAPLSQWIIDPKTGGRHVNSNAVEQLGRLFADLRPALEESRTGWRAGRFTDLAAMQTNLRRPAHSTNAALRALLATPASRPETDLLFVLQQHTAELEEIRAASRRPYGRFGIQGQDTLNVLLPHLSPLRSFGQAFAVKALAELAAGNPDTAAEDALTVLRLARTLRDEPILITTLVEYAIVETGIQPLWEGLARHQWQDHHLTAVQDELGRLNLVDDMARGLRGERIFCLVMLDSWRRRPADLPDESGDRSVKWLPGGFVDQNKVQIARLFQELVLPVPDPTNRLVDLRRNDLSRAELDRRFAHRTPYNVLAAMLLPAVFRAVEGAATAQSTVNLAQVACALERYRLAEGAYPEDLNALKPRFLPSVPRDVVNGEPLIYRRPAPDRFVLYSVGLNLKDDGGRPALGKQGRPMPHALEGDWVWPCTAETRP